MYVNVRACMSIIGGYSGACSVFLNNSVIVSYWYQMSNFSDLSYLKSYGSGIRVPFLGYFSESAVAMSPNLVSE